MMKWKIMWKEGTVVYVRVLSQHLPGGTEGIHGSITQDSRSPDYEAGVGTNHKNTMFGPDRRGR
jgi:hypothetical protein